MPSERRLAAILFTDTVGSTAVTARSESAGLALRDRHRALVRTQVERYRGRFVEAPGDESLSTFESAVDAVHAALAIQEALYGDPELEVRMGLHLGETMFRGEEGRARSSRPAKSLAPSRTSPMSRCRPGASTS
jgi:class 3 adenylate cyclase